MIIDKLLVNCYNKSTEKRGDFVKVNNILNKPIHCQCGKTHICNINALEIGKNALQKLPKVLENYHHILVVADNHTDPLCGETVCNLLNGIIANRFAIEREGHLVPDEKAIAQIEAQLDEHTDFILGIGSGVINDLCKYVSYFHGLKCGIVATAPSMDGYASSGAAMILDGMKVTKTTHSPDVIIGDTEILKNAPIEMIRSGYADIIGKYSALNDWKLSHLINGEHLCPFIYNIVKQTTDEIRLLAKDIAVAEEQAIAKLMEALVLVGACLTLHTTTRPGSGSEHHFSHYFEITGLIDKVPSFLHGIDVGYATVVTAAMRQRILKVKEPQFHTVSRESREKCYRAVYKDFAGEVIKLQNEAGRYDAGISHIYRDNWSRVLEILAECPKPEEIWQMLADVGMQWPPFEQMYGEEKIRRGIWMAKDLKDRYSVLWLYDQMFFTESESEKIYG